MVQRLGYTYGELGYANGDLHDESHEGFDIPMVTIDSKGVRSDTYRSYLAPVLSRKNLHVMKHAKVSRILTKNKRAEGVEFVRYGLNRTIYAKEEIILTAGVVGSPRILMLSGIGPEEHLKELNVS